VKAWAGRPCSCRAMALNPLRATGHCLLDVPDTRSRSLYNSQTTELLGKRLTQLQITDKAFAEQE